MGSPTLTEGQIDWQIWRQIRSAEWSERLAGTYTRKGNSSLAID
jgi:hypothetical protein